MHNSRLKNRYENIHICSLFLTSILVAYIEVETFVLSQLKISCNPKASYRVEILNCESVSRFKGKSGHILNPLSTTKSQGAQNISLKLLGICKHLRLRG